MLSDQQRSQEEQYNFPYHYVPRVENGCFSQVRANRWGYEYLSYMTFVLEQLDKLDCESVLDIGCGDGRLLHELSRRGKVPYLCGVDYSESAIALAKAFNPKLDFFCGDITDPKLLDGEFDAVTLIDVLEHIPPQTRPRFVQAVATRVRPGGALLVTVPSLNAPVSKKHYEHFNELALDRALGEEIAVIRSQYLNRECFRSRLLRRVLTNNVFILNNRRIVSRLYCWYTKKLLLATPTTGSRMFALCTRT